jgi:hypothetical protein
MRQPTTIVIWLVKIMSDQLPDVSDVNLDYNATIDLHLAVRKHQIFKNSAWVESLLASRVARHPWECLSRAWQGPDLNTSLAEAIIRLLPSSNLVDLPDELVDSATVGLDLTLGEGELAIKRLSLCHLPPALNHCYHDGRPLNTAPVLALALAIKITEAENPLLHPAALEGCQCSLDTLMRCIGDEFVSTWLDAERLARSATWMGPYTQPGK